MPLLTVFPAVQFLEDTGFPKAPDSDGRDDLHPDWEELFPSPPSWRWGASEDPSHRGQELSAGLGIISPTPDDASPWPWDRT